METGAARELEPRDINGSKVFATGMGWSPDETRLVFAHMNDIWVMDADGKNAFPAEQSIGALPPVLWWP
jgi:Tol biopolymer transport system component